MTPEPCLNLKRGSRCYSHTACHDFGYCRERNAVDGPPHWTTPDLIAARRRAMKAAPYPTASEGADRE